MIYGMRPLATMQLDDDPAQELVIRRFVGDRQFELAALGLGGARLRLRPKPPVDAAPPAPAALEDPLLRERWRRAGDLERLGLSDSAATALREAAMQTEEPQARDLLLDRAASLLEQQRRWPELLAVDRHEYVDAPLRTRARARRLQALRQLGRYQDALAEAEALLRDPDRSNEQDALARAAIAELSALLDGDAQIDLRFDVPLASSWQLRRPGAVRRAPARSIVELSLSASEGPVAELPIDWTGGPLALELEFEVELEFGACVEFALVDAGDRPWLGSRYCGQGGGGALAQRNHLLLPGSPALELREEPTASARERRPVRVQLAYFPARARVEAVFDDGQQYFMTVLAPSAPVVGRQRLVIAGASAASLARAELHRVRVRGARLVEPSPAELARFEPARRLAEREPLAALQALALAEPPPDHAATLRVLALAELDDLTGAREAVAELLPMLDDPRWLGDLALLVREYPVAGAALRERAGPRLLPALAVLLGHAHEHRNDAPVRDELLAELRGVERLTPTTPEQREALRELLLLRAELWEHSGASEHATADRAAAAAL